MDPNGIYKRAQKRIYEIVESPNEGDIQSRIFDLVIISLVVLNILCVIIDTVPSINARYGNELYLFEVVSVIIFSIEYLLRLWSCATAPEYAGTIKGRIKYVFSFMAVIDLLAILPFYLTFVKVDLRMIRVLRIFRIFRIAKLGRYIKGIRLIRNVIHNKKEELIITVVAMFCLLIISSSVMYFVENEAQPEVFSSIPASMWWGVCTLTSVGYGDVIPATTLGKLVSATISILGIGLFVLPAGILAAGFEGALQKREQYEHPEQCDNTFCPHCGKPIDKE